MSISWQDLSRRLLLKSWPEMLGTVMIGTHSQFALLTPTRGMQLLHCGLCRQRVRSQVWQSGRATSTSISVSSQQCRPPCPPLSIWGSQRYSLARSATCPQAGYCSSAHGKHAKSACMHLPHDVLVSMQPYVLDFGSCFDGSNSQCCLLLNVIPTLSTHTSLRTPQICLQPKVLRGSTAVRHAPDRLRPQAICMDAVILTVNNGCRFVTC